MGLSAAIVELSITEILQFYRVEEQRNRRVQDCRSGRFGEIVGHSEESFVDELR